MSDPWLPEGLQAERTLLARRRTALATLTASLAMLRLAVGASWPLLAGAGAVLLVVVVVGLVVGRRPTTDPRERLGAPHELPALTRLLCAAIPVLALMGAASLLA